eukprot:7063-Eustigmatos_ZCMA.PRE.1
MRGMRARPSGEPGLHDANQDFEIDRLGHVVIGPQAPPAQFGVALRHRRQKDERNLGIPWRERAQLLQQLEP